MNRWICPTGAHPAVLGLMRPRRDDVCRYCLECSRGVGRLVLRVAPRLEKVRKDRLLRAIRRTERRTKRIQRRTAAYYTVAGVNLADEMARMLQAKAFVDTPLQGHPPRLLVRRASRRPRTFGRAEYRYWAIRIVDYPGITATDVQETLCHELAHMATPGAGHSVRWKTMFRLAAEELLGVRPRLDRHFHGEVSGLLRAAAEKRDLKP
jgi:hypothetical protein